MPCPERPEAMPLSIPDHVLGTDIRIPYQVPGTGIRIPYQVSSTEAGMPLPGSTRFTEYMTLRRYPEYVDYQVQLCVVIHFAHGTKSNAKRKKTKFLLPIERRSWLVSGRTSVRCARPRTDT
eukprot:1550712-Rhodomonas_salina.1